MKYAAETIQEYFGDYSNVSSRLENFPDEDKPTLEAHAFNLVSYYIVNDCFYFNFML